MSRAEPKKTVDDFFALPEERGIELLEGEFVVSPTPNTRHQRIVGRLYNFLDAYVRRKHLGEVFLTLDVVLSRHVVFEPDLLFVRRSRLYIVKQRVEGPPDLVIEVLSRSTAKRDQTAKRRLYAKYGVREYWIVDPENRKLQVLSLKEKVFDAHALFEERDALSSPLWPDLNMDLTKIWA